MRVRLVAIAAFLIGGCGGAPVTADTEADDGRPAPPRSYERARARLEALTERRLSVARTDDVDALVESAQQLAREAAEETVSIVRAFDEVIRENGERWRPRCLVAIAAANRALALLIRTLDYQMPREVESQLRVLSAEDPEAARGARADIEASIAEALEARARPLDDNECVALRGALAALSEWPDAEIDDVALRERIRELPACARSSAL